MASETTKRSVLITGCSDGGLGAALAIAFHAAGLQVYATARNQAKMSQLSSLGIQTITLDILSEASIAACVTQVPALDILVNNAGAMYTMAVVDTPIAVGKQLFDTNVWGQLAVTQAFLPLLLKSPQPVIANQTSVASMISVPFQATYAASKAALAMFSAGMRLELAVFGIKVVDLKTGIVESKLIENNRETKNPRLPEGSIYMPAKEVVEEILRQDGFANIGLSSEEWAKGVVEDLLTENPPGIIWRGDHAEAAKGWSLLPPGSMDDAMKAMVGMDKAENLLQK